MSQYAVKEFFDRLAPTWSAPDDEDSIRRRIIDMAGFPRGGIVADIGCGTGVMTALLLEQPLEKIIAVDVSGGMIERARQRFDGCDRVEFICGDVTKAGLTGLDGALIFNAYPHFLDKPALSRAMARAIKPGGVLVIAHSRSRFVINGGHRGSASPVSTPLREAFMEANEFMFDFTAESVVDSDLYFIRLRRKSV